MTFLWPEMLWLLLARAGAGRGCTFSCCGASKKLALRYASLSMVKEAMGPGQRLRRHVPPLLFLLALIALIVAAARPAAIVTLPSQHETIILAMDVSGSMRADRRAAQPACRGAGRRQSLRRRPAAQRAHRRRLLRRPPRSVVQPPTHNREDIVAAIDRFQLQRGTAIGSGIIVSLATIFPDAGIDVELVDLRPRSAPRGVPLDQAGKTGEAGVQAGAAGLLHVGRDHPADRRPAHHRPRLRSKRPSWPPTAACAYSPSASARRAARPSASKAGRCASGSTRRRSRPSPT